MSLKPKIPEFCSGQIYKAELNMQMECDMN